MAEQPPPYKMVEVELEDLSGIYKVDEAAANRALGLTKTPAGYVWHPMEDTETLMLIPRDLHNAVRHTGGAAIIREKLEQPAEVP